MNNKTRLKITLIVAGYLMIIGGVSVFFKMENATIAVVTALTGAILGYVWAETRRPSK